MPTVAGPTSSSPPSRMDSGISVLERYVPFHICHFLHYIFCRLSYLPRKSINAFSRSRKKPLLMVGRWCRQSPLRTESSSTSRGRLRWVIPVGVSTEQLIFSRRTTRTPWSRGGSRTANCTQRALAMESSPSVSMPGSNKRKENNKYIYKCSYVQLHNSIAGRPTWHVMERLTASFESNFGRFSRSATDVELHARAQHVDTVVKRRRRALHVFHRTGSEE